MCIRDSINDNYGHAAGDKVIQAIGDILKDAIPDQSIAARLGGEEFVIFLSSTSLRDCKQRAEDICQAFREQRFDFDGQIVASTASVGIAEQKTDETLYGMLSRADDALYLAKSDGRDCVRCEMDLAVRELKRARVSLEDAASLIDGPDLSSLKSLFRKH